MFRKALPDYLREEQHRTREIALSYGLDFFPTIYEMVRYDEMSELASYGGFPTRYPHWRFGMDFEQMSKSSEYGLSRIYEMVINNNPAVAYLLEGNSLVDQKLVMAHVYGHVDFFKNNFAFGATNQGTDPRTGQPVRKWIDTMANHGSIVRKWVGRVGIDKVEEFIDHCLRLENLIAPHDQYEPEKDGTETEAQEMERPREEPGLLRVDREYMANFINPEDFVEQQRRALKDEEQKPRHVPDRPARDVLGFLIRHAPLQRWEREILTVIRREAYYFYPQMQTKIMNEGWATYWHSRLMTERLCDASEIVDYADRCAGVLATSGGQLNPYKLGVELFRHIEMRWNKGQFGKAWEDCDSLEARREWDRRTGLGRKKIFEVRKHHTDVTFIDEFLTPDFVLDQKLYTFGFNAKTSRFEIETRTFEAVKKKLLDSLTNAGQPFIYVVDSNHKNRGELLLQHDHQGVDLRLDWASDVLRALERIWSRPVSLHTTLSDVPSYVHCEKSEISTAAL